MELQQHCGFFGGLFCGLILIVIALHTNYLSVKEVAKPAMHNQALVSPLLLLIHADSFLYLHSSSQCVSQLAVKRLTVVDINTLYGTWQL